MIITCTKMCCDCLSFVKLMGIISQIMWASNWVPFSVFCDDGAQDYGLAKMHEIGKI